VPDDNIADIPTDVSVYYDAIPQEAFDDDDAPDKEEGEGAVESDCPVFMTGYDESEADCQDCADTTPDEFEACKEAVTTKAKAKAKKKGKGKPSKDAGKRTRYGHMPGSMAGCIDDMVFDGNTKEAMAETLVKEFGRDKDKATAKVTGHLAVLVSNKGVTIKEKKDGVLKAKEKYSEGYDKDNTVPASK